jgi:hypothetical protein
MFERAGEGSTVPAADAEVRGGEFGEIGEGIVIVGLTDGPFIVLGDAGAASSASTAGTKTGDPDVCDGAMNASAKAASS